MTVVVTSDGDAEDEGYTGADVMVDDTGIVLPVG